MSAGPEYPKIHTLFKRDERGVIEPWNLAREEFNFLSDLSWRWTEKVDGTNVRLHWDGEHVHVGGRTDRAQIPAHLLEAVEPYLDPAPWSEIFPPDLAGGAQHADPEDNPLSVTLYGEGYGPKIQKGGGAYRDDVGLIAFDVRVGRWWLKPEDAKDVARRLGIEVVPEVHLGQDTLWTGVGRVKRAALGDDVLHSLVARRRGKEHEPEGLVGTPRVPLLDRGGNRIITKLKLKDFRDLERRG